jgi:diguanylate cyclase (GGDEF)-like protein
VSGDDELGQLATKVNQMLDLIQSQMNSLTALSMTDALTGLANRRAFDARLKLELARAKRNSKPLALLILDVDFFKRYNDRYGHPAGDATLQAVANVLKNTCLRTSDLPARIGGEEFVALLPDTHSKGAMEIAERIRQLLYERQIAHEDSAVAAWVTVSIGVATTCDETPEALKARADKALYMAKEQGRNRACCADENT